MRNFVVAVLWLGLSAGVWAEHADLMLVNAKIVTLDAQSTIAQALAVQGDRILAVGSNDQIKQFVGPATRQIDVKGQCIIPGLIDSHVHATGASVYEFDHAVPDMETVADVLKHVAARAEQLDDGEWIIINQVFITRLRDQRYPTRRELDQAAPRNPVRFQTGPDCSLNSLALQLSGIDKSFRLPDGDRGLIERDETGEPTGILRNAAQHVKSKSPEHTPTDEERRERLRLLFADYNSVGLTSVADRYATADGIRLYQQLRDADQLTCRVFCSYGIGGQQSVDEVEAEIQKAAEHPLHQENRWVWVRGVKAMLDGGMLTGSAYMQQPWGVSEIYSIRDADYRGLRFIAQDKLERIARYALERELQFTAHSVGDGAVQALIDAYAAINESLPVKKLRPCITHCNFMSQDAIDQMRELGIVADLQPAWLWLDGATLEKQFGADRLAYFQPYRSLFDAGVLVGGGSDHMQKIGGKRSVNPYDPFLGIWIAIARQPRRLNHVFHPEQCITRVEALKLYTINNAFLTFEEHHKGTLEAGKLADFVVLNTDILTCPVEQIPDITVSATYLGGRKVYPQE